VSRAIRIGARRSVLARVQSHLVGRALLQRDSTLSIRYVFIETSGDRSVEQSAALVTARGGFAEDLQQMLRSGTIDLAVHSWKDLPLSSPAATEVVATLSRADARDVLLVRRDFLPGIGTRNLRILSSSARRRHHLEEFLGWALPTRPLGVSFLPVRGDIGMRLRKLLRGDGDALVIAKAAIDRLLAFNPAELAAAGVGDQSRLENEQQHLHEALAACRVMVLPLLHCPAAPAQGALALEVRHDSPLRHLLGDINDADSFDLVLAERAAASRMGDEEALGITRLRFPYGDIEFVRGSAASETFERVALHRRGSSLPRPQSPDALWTGSEHFAEDRERLPIATEPTIFDRHVGLLVARSEALPYGLRADHDNVVWTAGLSTWRKLAVRGIWVTGSDESLGETGAVAIRPWFPQSQQWLKLTHAEGHWTPLANLVATYRTRRRHTVVPVERFSHFFWNSGTQLRDYLRAFPTLRNAWHGCGPGNTYSIAVDLLGTERVRPFLNARHFRDELLS